MEPRFGQDFGNVRVHTNETAARSAATLRAAAYTVGSHIAFAPERYAPHTGAGRRLLAHELAHVVQMRALASPQGMPAAEALPVMRDVESGGESAPTTSKEEARRRRALASLDWLAGITPIVMDDDAPALIRWAEEKQNVLNDPDTSDEKRRAIATGLLRVLEQLKEFERRVIRDPDGALVYRKVFGDAVPWTEDRAQRLEDIWPFTPANIAPWRAIVAAPPIATPRGKHVATLKSKKQPTPETPERRGFAMNVTFPKQPGMTLKTEEGQRLIMRFVVGATRSGYTVDQLDWAVARLGLEKRWAPPAGMDLVTWQENFEAIPTGQKVTLTMTESFTTELDAILVEAPSRRAFQLEAYRQGVLEARSGLYLGVGVFAVGTLALGGGALLGSALGAGGIGGGGALAGGGLVGGEAAAGGGLAAPLTAAPLTAAPLALPATSALTTSTVPTTLGLTGATVGVTPYVAGATVATGFGLAGTLAPETGPVPVRPAPPGPEPGTGNVSFLGVEKEKIAGFALEGSKGLEGTTFVRRLSMIERLGGPSTEIGPIRNLFQEFEAEARRAGATELRVLAQNVRNENFFRMPRAWRDLGLTFRQISPPSEYSPGSFEVVKHLVGH